MATKANIDARLQRLERKKTKPPRIFVVIGSDEPRHPGEITIGGMPTDERPLPRDVVFQVEYDPAPITNPAALGDVR